MLSARQALGARLNLPQPMTNERLLLQDARGLLFTLELPNFAF